MEIGKLKVAEPTEIKAVAPEKRQKEFVGKMLMKKGMQLWEADLKNG